jgi:hypothetical protein
MLYRRGVLRTIREGMMVATVPRQTIARWLREAGIDIATARDAFIAKEHDRAERIRQDKPRGRRPNKQQQRAIASRKTSEWLDKGNTIKRL